MKQAIILLAMVGLSMACYTKRHQEEFEAFRRKYRKNYATPEEYTMRCLTFSDNFDEIEAHNSARNDNDYTMDVNQFSDLTNEEFVGTHMGFNPALDNGSSSRGGKFSYSASGPTIPASYDLEALGLVTEVKDQGACGSCYSFAANAHFESQILKLTKWYPHYFSEQSVLECTSENSCGNQLCQGGLMTNVYQCLMNQKTGVEEDFHYPYISYDGNNGTKCSHKPQLAKFIVLDFFTVDSDERAIQQAILLHGAIAVGINANGLQNYKNGIYNPTLCIGIARNHAVTICGWGSEGTKKYWRIKNSWGTGWGERGFYRHMMGKDLCGINGMASFSVLGVK